MTSLMRSDIPRTMRTLGLRARALLVLSAMLVATPALAQDGDDAPPPSHPAEPAPSEPAPAAEPKEEPAPSAEPVAEPKAEPKPEDHPAAEPSHPAEAADDYDIQDAKDAGYEVGEATSDPAEGLGVDGKDYELDLKDFEGMEGLDAKDLEALREVTPAELGELDMDHDMGDAAEQQLEDQAEALAGLDPDDLDRIAKLYIEVLRKKLHQVRDSTYDKTLAKIQQKNEEKVGALAGYFAWLSLSGLLLLFLPLVHGKKFPGQGGKLFGMSAMAAGSLVVAILMMSGVMLGMRTVQGSLGEQTNPQLVVQDAMFDGLDENLDDIAATPGLLLIPLQQVASGEKEDVGVAVLENAMQFKEDFDVFKSVASFFKSIQSIFGYVPIVLTGLAIVLFFVSIKDLIKDIVKAPERAMRGEIPATALIGIVFKRVFNEVVATLGTVGVLFVITLINAFALSFVAYPAMSMFVVELMATLQYVFVEPGASKAFVYIALTGVFVFLLLAIVSIVASSTLYIGKIQAILRGKLNQGIPLSTHKKFFTWQSLAVLWCIALPMGVLVGMSRLADYLAEKGTSGEKFDWSMALLPAPLGLVLGFLVIFVAAFGLKALLSIAKYKVVAPSADVVLGQATQALPPGVR